MHMVHMHTCRENTHKNKVKFSMKFKFLKITNEGGSESVETVPEVLKPEPQKRKRESGKMEEG